MIKNKLRLTLKLFIILWFLLLLQVLLKLTFNYWQPYVIPTPQLEAISNFIDSNLWLKILIDKIYFIFNGCIVLLCCLQQWKFKNKIILLPIIIGAIVSFVDDFTKYNDIIDTIITILLSIVLPLVINYKKWFWILLTFALSNVFLAISLWLGGFIKTDNMNYIIKLFFTHDYYIMLVLNYFVFNFIRIKMEAKNNG